MLHAVAKKLSDLRGNRLPTETHVIFISLNSVTPFSGDLERTGAYGAILIRSQIVGIYFEPTRT